MTSQLDLDPSLVDAEKEAGVGGGKALLSAYARRKETSTSSTRTVRFLKDDLPSSSSAKSEASPSLTPIVSPLLPQSTGEWRNALLPNFRQSLLGGKTLNRFSSFVTSGAEEWVLKGSKEAEQEEQQRLLAASGSRLPPVIQNGDVEGSGIEVNGAGNGTEEKSYTDLLHNPYKFLHSRENTDVSAYGEGFGGRTPTLPTTLLPGSSLANQSIGTNEPKISGLPGTNYGSFFSPDKQKTTPVAQIVTEADRHFVDEGPSWKEKLPPFKILVHSPSKRTSVLGGAYTVYSVTSLFSSDPDGSQLADEDPSSNVDPQSDASSYSYDQPSSAISIHPDEAREARITVQRRFSHFVILHTALIRRLPGIALPPLPEKQYAGRFNDEFVEARRGDLERYLNKIVRHPVARYAEIVTFFLGCESDLVSSILSSACDRWVNLIYPVW